MAKYDGSFKIARQSMTWAWFIWGLIIVFLVFLDAGTASAQSCNASLAAQLLVEADNQAESQDLNELVGQIRAAFEGEQPTEAQRACEMTALLDAAMTPTKEQVCQLDATVPQSSLVALMVLGSLNAPWGMPSSAKSDAGGDHFYSVLECLAGNHNKVIEQPTVREFMTGLESALANTKGGFFETLKSLPLECFEFDEKLAKARSLQSFSTAEFSIKSVVIEISALITSAATLENRPYCRTYEDALNDAVSAIGAVLVKNLASQSIEGWRWINDLLYAEAAYQIVLGNLDKALKLSQELEEMAVLSDFANHYAQGVHKASAVLIKNFDFRRVQDGIPKYSDQIFVSQPLPGFPVNLQSETTTMKREYFPVDDIAIAIKKVANLAKTSPPPEYPCKGDCAKVAEWVNENLSLALMRRDLRIVAGSFLKEYAASQTLKNLCSVIGSKESDCIFKVEGYLQYYRVTTDELPDDEAVQIVKELNERNIDSFVSRPRVLAPLSTLRD